MTRFVAAVAVVGSPPELPGVDRTALRSVMLEDVCDLVASLPLVDPALVVSASEPAPGLADLVAPGTPVLDVAGEDVVAGALAALGRLGADEAVLVAGDAPDLPALLVGKVFRGLGSADVAVVPADGGGLVALGVRLPVPGWYGQAGCGLDTPEAVQLLRAAAPSRRALSVAPGWHRVRHANDVARLDPDLEGWDATRTLLAGR